MGKEGKLIIYDLPGSGGQIHIHTDASGNYISNARIYDYSRENFKDLSSYEASMADYFAQTTGLKKIEK
ncbi:MAG: hypothetical protein AB1571_03440 [Nanoarchaeota archaeon]